MFEENDSPLTGSLSRSDERYISQGFASINKNLDQILTRMDSIDKKIDAQANRHDRELGRIENDLSDVKAQFEARVTRLETVVKVAIGLAGILGTIGGGIIINNWPVLTSPHYPSTTVQPR